MEEGQEGNNRAQSFLAIPPSSSFFLFLLSSLSVSSVTSLPGYTGPQGDLLFGSVPQHRAPPPPPPIPSLELSLGGRR